MKNHLLFSLVLGLICSAAIVAQETQRVEVSKASISFVPTSFLVKKNDFRFSASGERFGGVAFLSFAPSTDLASALANQAQVQSFEAQMKTDAFRKISGNAFAKTMQDSGLGLFTLQKSEFVTFNSLPAIRIDLSGTLNEIAYRVTAFEIFNPKLKKVYIVNWMCNEKHFEDFSKSLQPALDSIEFK